MCNIHIPIFNSNFLIFTILFSDCSCRKGLCDAHGLKSAGIVQLTFHEAQQMLPLEVATEANQNDRLRCSQTYPGAIQRRFWTLMQRPDTRDRMLTNIYLAHTNIYISKKLSGVTWRTGQSSRPVVLRPGFETRTIPNFTFLPLFNPVWT